MGPTLVLDLDGTLVDSVPDLQDALNRTIARKGLAPFSAPEVTAMVGDGAAALLRKAMAARGAEASPTDIEAFVADYTVNAAKRTRPFPGVRETLPALRKGGWRLAVCTNKPELAARKLLGALGLLPLFDAIGGGDSFPARKPDPAHLLATVAAAGGDRRTSVLVGDHRNDVLAASGAGIPCIFALWGYGPPAMAQGAAATAAGFAEAAKIAAGLLRHDAEHGVVTSRP